MIYFISIVSAVIGSLLYVICINDWKKTMLNESEGWSAKKKIPLHIIIMVMSFLFSSLFHEYGYGPVKSIKYCCLIWGLIPIALRDWKTKIIPNKWLIYLMAIRLFLFCVEWILYPDAILDNLVFMFMGAFVSGGVMFLAYVISRHEIGMGDIKLFIVTGMYLGLGLNYVVLLMSLIVSVMYSGIKILKKDLKTKDSIPFAPFVLVGTIVALGLGF